MLVWYIHAMGRPKKADRSTIADTFLSARLTLHELASLDVATARVGQTRGRTITRSAFVLEAIRNAIRAAGVDLDASGLLSLPFPASEPPPSEQSTLLGLGSAAVGDVEVIRQPPARSMRRPRQG